MPTMKKTIGSVSKLSETEAVDIMVKMHRQKIGYGKIADHLKALGYISSKTGRPLQEMAVRYNVGKAIKEENDAVAEDKRVEKAETEDKRILVVTSQPTLKEQINAISAMAGLPDSLKMRLINAVTNGDKQVAVDTADFFNVVKEKAIELNATANKR